MEKYTALTNLFRDLSLGQQVEIPAEFLNEQFPVWSQSSSANGQEMLINEYWDGKKFHSALASLGIQCHLYGRDPRSVGPTKNDRTSPSINLLVLGEFKPPGIEVVVVEKSFAQIALDCRTQGLGIGVASPEFGFHIATHNHLVSALAAIRDAVFDYERNRFLAFGEKTEILESLESQLTEFLNTFSSYLESIDFAKIEVGEESRLVFYLNFNSEADSKDFGIVQREAVSVLENLGTRCNVYCSESESDIPNSEITRIIPESFEVRFSRHFGPIQE